MWKRRRKSDRVTGLHWASRLHKVICWKWQIDVSPLGTTYHICQKACNIGIWSHFQTASHESSKGKVTGCYPRQETSFLQSRLTKRTRWSRVKEVQLASQRTLLAFRGSLKLSFCLYFHKATLMLKRITLSYHTLVTMKWIISILSIELQAMEIRGKNLVNNIVRGRNVSSNFLKQRQLHNITDTSPNNCPGFMQN